MLDNARVRRAAVRTVVASVSALVLAGCGSAAEPSPPTGVDGLEIPTPSPDPADFGTADDGVESPWLALDEPTAYLGPDGETLERRVAPGPEVAGVPTTAVTLGGATDLLAEDSDGNVWWFGHADADDAGVDGGDTWRAGVDGARAGLLIAATSRVGDGYQLADVPGPAADDPRATVLAVDDTVTVSADGSTTEYDDVVVLEITDADGTTSRASYARDVGLVLVESAGGTSELSRAAG